MKVNYLPFVLLTSILFVAEAHADPISFFQNTGNYILRIIQAGVILPVAVSGMHFKTGNHEKGWHWVKNAGMAAMIGYGGASIVSMLQSNAR